MQNAIKEIKAKAARILQPPVYVFIYEKSNKQSKQPGYMKRFGSRPKK